MDRAQISVFEQTHKVDIGGLLKGQNGRALEVQIALEILGDLANKALERQLTGQQFGRLLVTADLVQDDCSWPVAVGLLHATGIKRRLAGSLWWSAACVGPCLR